MASELHVHTTFSKLDAYGLPDQLVKRALHLGLKALAITDHANTAAHPKLEMACNKWGKCKTCGKIVDMKSIEHLCENPEYHTIKPLFGVELYLNTKRQKKNHITVIAQTLEGYRNLVSLASLAYSEGYFYYMPCVNIEDVIEYQKGLIILSGCMSGTASELINGGKVDEAEEHLAYLNNSIDNFFVEIQPLDLSYGEDEKEVNSKFTTDHLIAIADKYHMRIVATNDVHYITPEDRHLQHFVAMVRRKTNIKKFPDAMSERCCLASEDDFKRWLEPYGKYVAIEAIINQDMIADMCEDFKLPKATPMKWNDKPDEERYQEFVDLCNKGWNYRKCKGDNYKEQGKYEMSLIKEKGFYDYFLIVADMVQAAKDKNIMVGPGRGSVGGSLVSYMMRITEIDPIRFKLLFERFLDPSRTDSPDIDLDFQDDRRDEVKDYMKQKWGEDKVKNIAGYTMYHDKGLLDDIGRCYCIPPFEIDRFKKMLIIEGGDKSLEEILVLILKNYRIPFEMQRMLGQLRGFTVHAAGLIVSSEPLKNITTIMGDSIALDKRDAEYLDILKIDALSLTTLRVISLALEKIGMTVEELYNLPLDIKDVYKGFKDAQMQGIFQFAGGTTKSVCRKALRDIEMDSNDINFDEVFDIVTDVNTLSRPASMNNGSTARYIENEVEEIHPWITKHTQATRGQIIYQEQIMKVLKEGGLSWEDIGAVRKLITKHEGAEKLEGIKNRFIDGLIKFGTRKDICKQVWDRIGDEGAYGFNLAHCVAYTLIAYFTMYLKVTNPLVFYWANMMVDNENGDMLREFAQNGGKVLEVRFGSSLKDWSMDLEKNGLRAGYAALKGIGPKTADKLVELQESHRLPSGEVEIDVKDFTAKIFKTLNDNHAFDDDAEKHDFLGFNNLSEAGGEVDERELINEITSGVAVVLVKLSDWKVKNLREYYKKNNKDYEEVKQGHLDTYVNMKVYDESGEMALTISRYKYPTYKDIVAAYDKDKLYKIKLDFSDSKNKGYILDMSVIGEEIEWDESNELSFT